MADLDGPEEVVEEISEDVLPLFSEMGPVAFQPYVLDLDSLGHGTSAVASTLAFVVMTRNDGLLLALPELALLGEVLDAGMSAGPLALVGPHTLLQVQVATMDEDAIATEPEAVAGKSMTVLLVDLSVAALPYLKPASTAEELADVMTFDVLNSTWVPHPPDLVSKALAWAASGGSSDRLQFYSADEADAQPLSPEPKAAAKRKVTPGGGSPGGRAPKAGAKRKVTVSSLAETLDQITQALPAISNQLHSLSQRTSAIEAATARGPDRASALRRPLGELATDGSASPSGLGGLVKAMPPPRSTSGQMTPRVTFAPQEAEEIAENLHGEQSDLAKAVLAQSQALTALVNQIAGNSGDPLQDMASSSTSISSRGSVGRARLQNELAAHKGVFFMNVLQNMSRRMFPSQLAEVELSVLQQRGVTPTQYLERFGGFGRSRDLGFIIWQVALCMNFLQEDNMPAAKDSLSLLFVCLEQAAMDGGKLDVGLLLALVEDPPQALFSGRSLAAGANPKPFAPTASQRWVTTALQYLKELDVISTRRAEATSSKQTSSDQGGSTATPSARPKAKKGAGKGAAKAKAAAAQNAEEEA